MNLILTSAVLGAVFLSGLICIVIFSSTIPEANISNKILAVMFMIALSFHVVGWLLGFLFGIPKSMQEDSKEDELKLKSNITARNYNVNTNLELVSDWLTKILVGVGLTQFNNIKDYLVDTAHYFSIGINSVENIEPMIMATIVYYSINGFLSGYFITRLFLSSAFFQVESGE